MAMRKTSCYCSVFWRYPLINSNLRLKLPWILIWRNQPAMLDSPRTWCFWRPPMSHTFAQRPDTAADVASAAEELATFSVPAGGIHSGIKKCEHEARNYRVGSITPVWCWKLVDKFGSTNTKYDVRDEQNPSPTTHHAQGQWSLMIPPGKKTFP